MTSLRQYLQAASLLCLGFAIPSTQVAGSEACEFKVLRSYPHDRGAFTQGLLYHDGLLYESTGRWGESTLREVDLKTGRVLRKNRLTPEDFGEGLALVDERLVQLTWTSQFGYIWERESFKQQGTMPFLYESPHESGRHHPWGLCYDGSRLVLSNGTARLHFLDPTSFKPIGSVDVHDDAGPVPSLNELECIGKQVFANVWKAEQIAIIDVETGRVDHRLDLMALHPPWERNSAEEVLNGIAWYPPDGTLLVTGKYWPKLFELELSDACLTPSSSSAP